MQLGPESAIYAIVVLILSVILHEVAHGYAAYALGDPTAKLQGRLTLNPLAHIDPIGSVVVPAFLVLSHAGFFFGWAKPVPYNPYNLKNQRWGEALVGAAGVATNLALALIFSVAVRGAYAAHMSTLAEAMIIIVFVNLSLGLFNLIPIPPLDGFTVLRGILPYRAAMPLLALEQQMRRGGFFTLIIVLLVFNFVLAGPFYNLVLTIFRFLVG